MKKVRTLAQAKADPRILDWSDERSGPGDPGDGIWLYLKRPWWCPDTDLSTIHEWSVRDLCDSLNRCYEAPERWDSLYGLEEEK